MTFTQRYLDPAFPIEYKAFCIFEDKLCIWDHGPNNTDGQVLHTADGVAWSTLFSRTAAQIGATGDQDGKSMAVYNGNLFITKYGSPSARVIEWDGSDVHLHLEGNLFPQPHNYMASNLVVWDGKLWCLLDVTSGIAWDRRVVYYYDGASWTPVTNYAGADYLNYSTGANLPEYDIKQRTTRLFVFNDELYLIATSWYGAGAKWAWEVWKFDATAYDNFTKLYDSDVFDDGYALAAIMEFEGNVKIVGNYLAANGNAGDDGKLYTSPDMVNWTLEATQADMYFPYGEILHEGKFYLNCSTHTIPHNTQIKRWEGRLNEFTLDQEITTNPASAGGGLAVFNGGIYAGKYWEVYGEPGTNFSQTRLKRDSLPLMEIGYKDMFDNKHTERVAPIDTRAPDRFYHGRIKQMSSLKRAVDDKTGLFQVADMSITLANADKHYSQLLASHILKNQEATLYHAWTDKAEVLRLEVIKLIVEDHSMKGPDFTIKLKDITQKYFTMQVPENICTKDNFPNIHPDYEGWCMPEILGYATIGSDCLGDEISDHQSTYSPTLGASVDPGDVAWTNPGFIYGIDSMFATAELADGENTKRLRGSTFGFNLPICATIVGIKAEILRNMWGNGLASIQDQTVRLLKAGVEVGDDKSSGAWPIKSDAFETYGGDADLWGTTWTPAEINAAGFGLSLKAGNIGVDTATARVNYYRITVYYTAFGVDYEHPGAVEAVYVDTAAFRYLAAAGVLKSIPAVYSDDVLMLTPADYSIVYPADGHTYIDFVEDQGDKTVAFDAQGYSLAAWDSANGYIQNLAYIIQYYLRYIMGIPASLINAASFLTLAGYYEEMGVHENGYLILQDRTDAMEILRQLLFTGGAKGFMALDGKFTVARKNICNWQVTDIDRHIFEQIELFGSPHRKWNLTSAINTVNVQYGYIPWQDLYTSAIGEYRDNRFERPMEDRIRDREPRRPRGRRVRR